MTSKDLRDFEEERGEPQRFKGPLLSFGVTAGVGTVCFKKFFGGNT
jgi:hypothetical protein